MEPKQQRSLELRGVVTVVAVVVALMGISASLATKEQSAAAPVVPSSTESAYQDPSLIGLRVAEDAEVDRTVEFHN